MKKLLIIVFSIIAMASLLLLVSRQPNKQVTKIDPVKMISDSLLTPTNALVKIDLDTIKK